MGASRLTLSRDNIPAQVRRTLLLLTDSYPYGLGETFLSNEIPYLITAFDEILILCNDVSADMSHELPAGIISIQIPYALSLVDRLRSAFVLLDPAPHNELRRIRDVYSLPITGRIRKSVFLSWARARKFSRILRRLGQARPRAQIYAYSYWANDMALAAALARSRGWVDFAICRAHGWDVYFERSEAGVLPFRAYLAEHLDHYRFISKNGLAYFQAREGVDSQSLGVSSLGTPIIATTPLAGRNPFVLVSCSAMIPLKRVERIAAALALVRYPITWIHIGDGPSRPIVDDAVTRLPASVAVDLTGALSNAQVLQMYRDSTPSLFINLSESEGVPVAIMEAMSAGVPALATAVGGVPELVSHGRNGILLAPDPDVADVSAAIESFMAMPAGEYARYAEAAQDTWRRKFNAEVNFPQFITDALGATLGK